MSYLRATRVLCWLLGIALVVSVVHYVDNYVNYDDYPLPADDATIPAPSAGLVAFAWFLFTAFGGIGLLLWFRRHITTAAIFLTGYSLSGLIGILHYTVPGASDMVWWRQTHVVADIVCGAAVLGFALWAARNSSELIPPGWKPSTPQRDA
ncbi:MULTISPECIES: hypothetical protein [unclassified Nocardioides]|uniref:hypothetical protein n=1 Tax=unclassified Nocardioides TaxID=2615069 RepID=UPI000703378A|nr:MULTISPECIES: hypothetical protein [unclassified Nocardioides]KRC52733.1 hypothetical protein ASE19_09940 [Nocardioides sp. Root79]KRC72264.1 hypothetical protein ASE20_06475 [Nocardioides sp. Root240]